MPIWKDRISREVLTLTFSNTISYEIIKKIKRANSVIEPYMKLSLGYRNTKEKLLVIEHKLKNDVIILQRKDAKSL